MAMRWPRPEPLLVASILAAGCEYPVYGFVPDDAGSGVDGAADVGSDTTIDAAVDDTNGDTVALGDTGDAGIDADDTASADTRPDTGVADAPSDALVTKGCAGSVHAFCADFDSVLMPQTGWTDSNLVGGGTNLIDHALFTSPSGSYAAAFPTSAATEAAATLNEDFSLSSASALLTAEAWVRLDDATSPHDTLLLKLSRVGSGNGVDVSIGASGLVMDIVGTPSSGTFHLYDPTPNVWFKIKLEVVLATGTGGSAKAYIDDTLLVTQTGVATTTSTATSARLVVGVYQSETSTTAMRAIFDDVTFDNL